jgi:glycosyltransferase involved in cell wall biosynthesis
MTPDSGNASNVANSTSTDRPSMNKPATQRPSASDQLHLLTLTPFYPSTAEDANGCFVSEPLESLSKLGVRNTVLALQPFYRGRPSSRNSAAPGEWLQYFSFPGGVGLSSAGKFAFARIAARLRNLHKSRPIDLIHAHGALPCGHAAVLAGRELNVPYVVSVHGLDAFSTVQVPGFSGERCRHISRRVYEAASRVICVSEHVRDSIREEMAETCSTSVVYNGVDSARFTPTEATAAQKILSVGNLIPIKGHSHVICAMAAIAGEFPFLQLDIIGDGAGREHLATLTRQLRVEEKVRFLGRQSRAQVAEAMRQCTIFALPSRYEALGCVYLEAMACGKPAIGCRGQGIAEIIQHGTNGFLVDADGEQELASVLSQLLREPARAHDVGTAARQTILSGLTLQHQAANLIRIYRECLR